MRVCQSSSGAVPGVGLTPLQEVAYMLLPLEGGAGTALCVEAEQQVQQSLETHEPRLLLEQLLKPLQSNLGRHSHLVPGSSETSNRPPTLFPTSAAAQSELQRPLPADFRRSNPLDPVTFFPTFC